MRLGAVDVDAQPRGTRPTAPRTVAGSWLMHAFVSCAGSVAGRRGRRCVVGPAAGHVVADLVEVPLEGVDDGVGVAALDGVEDRSVEVGRPLRVRAGNDEGDVGPRERLERAPDPFERAVVGELDDPPVEAGVGLGHAVAVVVARRRAHRLEVPGELRDVGVGQPRNGQPSRRAPRASSGPRTPR